MILREKSSPNATPVGMTIKLNAVRGPEVTSMNFHHVCADIIESDARSRQSTDAGVQAYCRLLKLAEERDSGQISRVARFLAATYNGRVFPFDPFELRAVDTAISEEMLCCLDALRWGRADLHTLIPDGDARLRAVLDLWGLRWPEPDGD